MFEIVVALMAILLLFLCVVLVFVFDDMVLNKHFTNKLRSKLGIER